MTLQEIKRKTTSREFVIWKYYLQELEPNEFRPEFHYWANIVRAVEQAHAKKGHIVKLKDKLLQFKFEKKPKSSTVGSLVGSDRVTQSKRAWLTAVGLMGPKIKRHKQFPPKPKKSK